VNRRVDLPRYLRQTLAVRANDEDAP